MRCTAAIIAILVSGVADAALADTFLVVNTDDAGPGSLRQAIVDANAAPGHDTIAFAIAGAPPHTIAPLSPLPDITGPTAVDGFSQAGPGVHAIVLAGNAAGAVSGLRLQGGGGSSISGLVINRFVLDAIQIVASHDNGIFECYIGLHATGTTPGGAVNQRTGVRLLSGSTRNAIGAPGLGNVMSANVNGVALLAGCTENTVQGNIFGTDKDGAVAVGRGFGSVLLAAGSFGNLIGGAGSGEGNVCSNGSNGISVNGDHNQIVGNLIGTDRTGAHAIGNDFGVLFNTAFGTINRSITGNVVEGNLVSGNILAGVALVNGSTANIVRRNRIGTDAGGTGPLGNGLNGVAAAIGANDNVIEENLIAFNGASGVVIALDNLGVSGPPTGNRILANSIHSNAAFGIDLNPDVRIPPSPDGPNLNDPLDVDDGPNRFQNFPVLSAKCFRNPALIQVWGSLDSTPLTAFRIEVFTSREARVVEIATPGGPVPFLSAQGEALNGSTIVTTDANGHADFHFPAKVGAPAGDFLTATATSLTTGDTSEFSEAVRLGKKGK